MAKSNPADFPELIGDAALIPYFKQLPRKGSESTKIPPIAAVYFVYAEPDLVLYIGQAINLKQRWKTHRMLRMMLDQVKVQLVWLPVPDWAALAAIERYYIRKLRPPMNKIHARGIRSAIGPKWLIADRIEKLKSYNV